MEAKIYCGDNLSVMRYQVPEESVDFIVTSPPYNLGVEYLSHNDAMPYDRYLSWLEWRFIEMHRCLKPDGRIAVNVALDTQLTGPRPLGADITKLLLNAGFQYKISIIWANNYSGKSSAWGSYQSASSPNVATATEIIIVCYKKEWKKQSTGVSTITPSQFAAWTKGLWTFSGEHSAQVGDHPAPFPLELPRRLLRLFSYKGELVMDPFCGSGTAGEACALEERDFIGIDLTEYYCDYSRARIERANGRGADFPIPPTKLAREFPLFQ